MVKAFLKDGHRATLVRVVRRLTDFAKPAMAGVDNDLLIRCRHLKVQIPILPASQVIGVG